MSGDINVQTFSGKVNISNNLKVGSGHLFVDTLNNQVGLNTNDPQANLHVNGNTYVHTNFRVGSGIVMNDTTGRITAGAFHGDGTNITGINSDSGSWVNGTDVVHLATTGDKVGIGTVSPSSIFNTYGGGLWDGTDHTSKVCATLQVGRGSGAGASTQDAGTGAILEFRHHSDYRFVTLESVSEGNYSSEMGIRFKTMDATSGPEERMRIDAHGNVGIGVTTVDSGIKLQVNGVVKATGFTGIQASDVPTLNQNTTGTSGGIAYTQLAVNSPNVTSGTWTTATSASWGPPKFNTPYDQYAYNDAPGHRQWNIPTGMKSAYISQLTWNTGGYADVHGVQSDGGLVFLRRINTRQGVENTDEGGPQYDGSSITFIGSGLDSFSAIRITNKAGRLHLTGLAFTPTLNGTEGTGMVHPQQLATTLSASQIPTLNQNTTGTAATLTTARTIGGVNFDGSVDIVLPVPTTFGAAAFSGDVAVDTDTLFVDTVNDRVGVNIATPAHTLDVAGDINLSGSLRIGGAAQTFGGGGGGGSSQWTTVNSTEIHYSSGNVGIGTTDPAHTLHVDGNIYASGNVTAYSDARKKTNLQIIDNSLNKIEKINGYTYEKDNVRYTGLVAQEVLSILPEAVVGNEEDGYGLAYGNMVGILVEAIKELSGKVKSLEEKLYS